MREFLHGWRRKVGGVTLIMATALAVLWFRTAVVADFFQLGHVAFGSARGGIYLVYHHPAEIWDWATVPESELCLSFGSMSLAEILLDELSLETPFGYVLYWWLILPLTLLSAYLIIWKPRQRPKSPHA